MERIVAVLNNTDDVFETDLYTPIISKLESLLGIKYSDNKPLFRVVADHMKSATFLGFYNVTPSNKQQGYVLRKFIRRAAIKIYLYNKELDFASILSQVPEAVYEVYKDVDSSFGFNVKSELISVISEIILNEALNFKKVLSKVSANE